MMVRIQVTGVTASVMIAGDIPSEKDALRRILVDELAPLLEPEIVEAIRREEAILQEVTKEDEVSCPVISAAKVCE